jgi:hypothetical protein
MIFIMQIFGNSHLFCFSIFSIGMSGHKHKADQELVAVASLKYAKRDGVKCPLPLIIRTSTLMEIMQIRETGTFGVVTFLDVPDLLGGIAATCRLFADLVMTKYSVNAAGWQQRCLAYSGFCFPYYLPKPLSELLLPSMCWRDALEQRTRAYRLGMVMLQLLANDAAVFSAPYLIRRIVDDSFGVVAAGDEAHTSARATRQALWAINLQIPQHSKAVAALCALVASITIRSAILLSGADGEQVPKYAGVVIEALRRHGLIVCGLIVCTNPQKPPTRVETTFSLEWGDCISSCVALSVTRPRDGHQLMIYIDNSRSNTMILLGDSLLQHSANIGRPCRPQARSMALIF